MSNATATRRLLDLHHVAFAARSRAAEKIAGVYCAYDPHTRRYSIGHNSTVNLNRAARMLARDAA